MKKWFVETEYMACRLRLETDAVGNMGAAPLIELYPENLVKEEWAEETETGETEEVRTFTLGGNTYTYDVTSIVISGENIGDLSPLAGLGSLLYLDLHGCVDVSDISPIINMSLKLLHTCETGVSYEQTRAYKDAHPDCEVWWDNHTL